jgi:glycosyltransferase involved in cell wall biosynthesis
VKVLQVNDYRSGGGAEIIVQRTVRLLRERGLEVELLCSDDVPGRRTPLSYIDSRAARRALEQVLVRFGPDVVHLHNFYHMLSPGILGTLAAYRRSHRLRVVMTAHDAHLVCPNSGLYFVRRGTMHPADETKLRSPLYLFSRRWDRRGLAWSLLKLTQHVWSYRMRRRHRVIDRVLCPSRHLEALLGRSGLPARFVPHPAPLLPPGPDDRRPSTLELVYAGRIEPEKGMAELLSILPRDFPGRLTIIGDGAQLERCRRVCRTRGLNERVAFSGRLPHDETIAAIRSRHVLVLPSLCAEGCPLSLLEALACRTTILVSDLGGMREVVRASGTGFVFTPGSAQSLRRVLGEIDAAFRAGSLNAFDARPFLGGRSEEAYVERLLATYD